MESRPLPFSRRRLAARIANWLRAGGRCVQAAIPAKSPVGSVPVLLGVPQRGEPIVVVCVTSRDALAVPAPGRIPVALRRFVAAPEGLLTLADLPAGWRLLEVDAVMQVHGGAAA